MTAIAGFGDRAAAMAWVAAAAEEGDGIHAVSCVPMQLWRGLAAHSGYHGAAGMSLGNSSRADHKAAGQVKLDRRYILWAVVGLILIMVGTVCQIVPNRL